MHDAGEREEGGFLWQRIYMYVIVKMGKQTVL